MRWICVMALAGCAGGSFAAQQRRAVDRNAGEHDKAHDKLLLDANGAPFQPAVAVVEMTQAAVPSGGILGLRPGEALYAMPDGELALMPHTCIRGSACGCEVSREYTYLRRPDGSVVVARLTPVVHERQVKVASCGTGCGIPAQRELASAVRLGVRQVTGIQFVEATYPYELVVETCDHPSPRP